MTRSVEAEKEMQPSLNGFGQRPHFFPEYLLHIRASPVPQKHSTTSNIASCCDIALDSRKRVSLEPWQVHEWGRGALVALPFPSAGHYPLSLYTGCWLSTCCEKWALCPYLLSFTCAGPHLLACPLSWRIYGRTACSSPLAPQAPSWQMQCDMDTAGLGYPR